MQRAADARFRPPRPFNEQTTGASNAVYHGRFIPEKGSDTDSSSFA